MLNKMTITSDSYFRNQVLQCVVCMLVNSSNIINYTLKNCNDIEYSKMLLKLFMVWFSIIVFNSNTIWCIWYIWCSLINQKLTVLFFKPQKLHYLIWKMYLHYHHVPCFLPNTKMKGWKILHIGMTSNPTIAGVMIIAICVLVYLSILSCNLVAITLHTSSLYSSKYHLNTCYKQSYSNY